ncbi:MAG: primase-helicase family protein [Pseudomonadota bacterium]|nr:primase-helicase family protein [Pseudomonadota bacterium]
MPEQYSPEVIQAAKKICATYVKEYLKPRGYLKISNDKLLKTRVYNRYTKTNHDNEILLNQFYKFLSKNEDLIPANIDTDELEEYFSEKLIGYAYRSLTLVAGEVFEPDRNGLYTCPKSDLDFVNTWEKYSPVTTSQEVSSLWYEFLERMFPDDAERHKVCQWLAHMFQRPRERPSWHLMLTSEAGTGKGFLVGEVLTPLLCDNTHILKSFSQLMGKFSHSLESNMLILLDDTKSKSASTQTELKSVLSEERQYIEKKGFQGEMKRTYARLILASNETRPLRLDGDERRWFAPAKIVHKESKEETQAFITKLYSWLSQDGSLDTIYNWFMSYDLTDFNHKSVEQSNTLKRMIESSESVSKVLALEWANDKKVFTYNELKEEFKQDTDLVKSHIIEAGWIATARNQKAIKSSRAGKAVRLIHPAEMTHKEAVDLYDNPMGYEVNVQNTLPAEDDIVKGLDLSFEKEEEQVEPVPF